MNQKYIIGFALALTVLFLSCKEESKSKSNELTQQKENIQNNTGDPFAKSIHGNIDRLGNFKSNYVPARNVDVWMPKDYKKDIHHQVIYMNDGQNVFDKDISTGNLSWDIDETLSNLMIESEVLPTIIVAIWSHPQNRFSEYFPYKPLESIPASFRDDFITNAKNKDGEHFFPQPISSDNYLKFIVEELKPYIDKNYATLADMEYTSIMGAGVGALNAIYALCEYPEVFGNAACLSTHLVGIDKTENNPVPRSILNYLDNKIPKPGKHHLYFDLSKIGDDAVNIEAQRTLNRIIMNKNYMAQDNWKTMLFEDHQHDERFWKGRAFIPLRFILK